MSLKALLIINRLGKVALIRYGGGSSITALRYHIEARMCVLELTDGAEEALNDEISAEVAQALVAVPEALLIDHDDRGTPIGECVIPIKSIP